ncbi:conserved exported hypothetical protein [Flavobacterium sp. 9AF]|uniref:hypothetical protein n=1 Tax=Flavobacterium sp. 9AF TaxID=2653142 RepID=UPI0012F3486A|nr:hypothetical protein [Flavobacterium sp. 9AF]VXB01921.1 conserved exported hypothetical protein [Flavobacterium sp. 9AF]
MRAKIFFLTALFFTYFSAFSQDIGSLKTEVTKIYKATASMDYDGIFETTYPKVFDIIPKETMKEMFQQMMSNDDYNIKLIPVEPNFSFGEIKKIGTQTFCLIDHDNVMQMKFKKPIIDKDAETMIGIFKKSMDAKEVTFDKDKNEFTIKLRSTLIGVYDDSTSNKWKFLNKDKENQLFNMIFDENVKTALGL